jgi:iron(III) transport system substrate-binding protein
MRRSVITYGLVSVALLLFYGFAAALDVPKWWLGSQDEYEKLVKAAQKEGEIVLWSHPDPACKPLILDPFEKEYGIKVEHTEYTTAAIVQRVLLEGVAGMYTVDLSNLSVHHVPRLEKKKLIKQLPYKKRVKTYRDIPALVSPHSNALIVWTNPRSLAFNTEKVPKNKIPRTYEDVLDPMFKDGKISVDTDLKEYIILAQEWGLEKTRAYLKKLGEMKPKFHPNNTVITQMIAAGEALIGPGVIERIPNFEFKTKGAPIDWRPLSPIVPLDTMLMGVMSHAPHPNAAELFSYWMLGSPEWLRGMDKCGGYGNALVPGDRLHEALKEIKTIPFGWEWGVRAAKEGWGEQFRRIIGVE